MFVFLFLFPDEVSSAELASLYQAVWSASFCQFPNSYKRPQIVCLWRRSQREAHLLCRLRITLTSTTNLCRLRITLTSTRNLCRLRITLTSTTNLCRLRITLTSTTNAEKSSCHDQMNSLPQVRVKTISLRKATM